MWISRRNKQKVMILFSYKTHHEVTSWAASALIRWLETKTRTVSITARLVASLVMCQVTWWLKSLWMTSTWSIYSCSRDSSLWTTQVMRFIIYNTVRYNTWADCSGRWLSRLDAWNWNTALNVHVWAIFCYSVKSLFTFSDHFSILPYSVLVSESVFIVGMSLTPEPSDAGSIQDEAVVRRMVALFDYDPWESSPNVDSDVSQRYVQS